MYLFKRNDNFRNGEEIEYTCFYSRKKKDKNTTYTELDDTLDKYPYCDALKKVDGSCLTKSQKVFVYFLKKRNYGMLKFLVDGRIWLKNIKGARLK